METKKSNICGTCQLLNGYSLEADMGICSISKGEKNFHSYCDVLSPPSLVLLDKPTYKVKEISARASVTTQLLGNWYKSEFSETRELLSGCNVEAERAALWETVNNESFKQYEELVKSCREIQEESGNTNQLFNKP